MSFWSAMVAIVAIIAWANIRMNKDKHRGSGINVVDHDPAHTASLEREVAEMRKRLEVLERIATEDGETRRLSREIESLREK
ncbi:hypothetical protein IP81_10840 [Novosphingobium sp. AAP83]|uniref:hypothetical protein n=1 Tax=Novosphingobium sp. AAP83 TaxID=1523425 RepID=UPI0006CCC5C2|nr:hypothetical protein [Novosphingobium sp. AAP83]KPF91410.1 hypothetical protein IP81_10840 [Novosphingobium sp. AAP83]